MSSDSENTINNKRIAKNTALLYVRMLFLMAVGLFTSRVILASLGVVDYGISNVVGGVVAMFGFLNAAMTTSTQRYLTYELGRGETGRLRLTFMTSVHIHIIIAATVVLLAETIGLWFLKNKIVIPSGREAAAMYCYQFAILSTVVSILNYPFNAAIVAHERMDAFAYISILDVMLKLGVAYTIYAVNLDKLIVYSILMLLVQIVMTSIYAIYCKRHFEETRFKRLWDTSLLKEMGSFAGWNMCGNVAYILFKPLVSFLKAEVTFGSKLDEVASSERLQSIIFRQKVEGIAAPRAWTGDFTMNLTDLASGLAAVDGKTSSQIAVKLAKDEEGGISVGRKAVVYAAIAPGIKKGDEIEIQLLTDSHKVSFEVKALADFQAGACYDIPLNLDDLKPENNCTVENISTTPLEFKSFGFEIAKNESSLLKKTAVLNTSTSKTEVKAAEDFSCAIDKNAGTVSCCIPYLYNFTLVPTFKVPEGVKVLCNGEVQESGVSGQDFRTPVEYTLVSGTQRKVFTVTVTNTGLPVVVINVNSPGTVSFLDFAIPAKGTKWSEADDIAVYKNGVADLNKAGCGIRLRGNTSSNYDKRPMAIKLNKKAGILGMKEHKRWILLSPWTDMSLIRNYLAFNIAQTIQNHFINGPTDGSTLGKGLVWNPSGQNVELVINGIHAGNYLFCEQIKINKNRLKMTNPIFEDVVEKNTSPTVKDCSYLIEFDNNYDETWKFKTTMRELPCLFKDDFKVTATNGTTYDGSAIFESLKTYINTIESNLTNGYYTEAYKSLDINSVIDYWFVYEIAMNDEIQHPKSVYMYKDGDGKLSAGPVWDFDSQNFTNVDTEKNAYYYHTWSSLLIERAIKYNETPRRYYMWWPLLMKDQNYINRVKARWADVYPDLIDVANRVVEERRAANRLSDEYNRKIWKVGNYLDEHWLCGDENMEFDDVMDNLKYCYNKRLENLNNTITNLRKW